MEILEKYSMIDNLVYNLFSDQWMFLFIMDNTVYSASSIISLGKIIITRSFSVGGRDNEGYYFRDFIGEIQVVRFSALPSNIISIVSQIFLSKKCLSSYPNQISGGGWWDFNNGVMRDKWNLQPNLTNTGGAVVVKTKY